MSELIHEVIGASAARSPAALALRHADRQLTYGQLHDAVRRAACALLELGLPPQGRVAVFLEKREEAVLALFGAAAAGGVFVPIDPLLRPDQVGHILRDSGASILVTSPARLAALDLALAACPQLRAVLQTGDGGAGLAGLPQLPVLGWNAILAAAAEHAPHHAGAGAMAALLYSADCAGPARARVLTHDNLVAGARSLAACVGAGAHDRILAVLPLSGEYGLAQLTSSFASGAAVVLSNPLLTRDIVETVETERITGLAAVPSQWIQLAALDWRGAQRLRYLTNSSGTLPAETVLTLRARLPGAAIYLMHGSADACRSTYLAPDQAAVRPGSIGKAVPGAEVLVLAPDGRRCAANEPGELVQRGALVPAGYWNGTAMRPAAARDQHGPGEGGAMEGGVREGCVTEGGAREGGEGPAPVLWSGDLVRMDDEGYLYYVGRGDELIASGGYRISPREVEDVVRATGMVAELAVLGLPHAVLGHSVVLVARAQPGCELAGSVLQAACRAKLPPYMVPARVLLWPGALPRDASGAIDRAALARALQQQADAAPGPVPAAQCAAAAPTQPPAPLAAVLPPGARAVHAQLADAAR